MASYDFIVVGGGSAGCVAASHLVTKYNAKVLLLEAGADKRSIFAKIPVGTVKMWSGKTDYIGRFRRPGDRSNAIVGCPTHIAPQDPWFIA